MYSLDFIGDIHGHYSKFFQLLEKLGYHFNSQSLTFTHPDDRKLVVLGDFLNVGMQNLEVLSCIFNMHQQNKAYVISGNHEYFLALLYVKTLQNKNTLWYYIQRDYFPVYIEFVNKKEQLYKYIEWLLDLPIFIDFGTSKAIHAIWDEEDIEFVKNHNSIKKMIDYISLNPTFKERLNKIIMGITFKVKKQNSKKPIFFRYKWWENIENTPINQLFMHKTELFSAQYAIDINFDSLKIKTTHLPVFFGHYNLQGFPYLTNSTKCCLDFGGAKGGYLTAYRWDGEDILDANKIIYV